MPVLPSYDLRRPSFAEQMRRKPIIRYETVMSTETWRTLYTYVDVVGWPWLSRVRVPALDGSN